MKNTILISHSDIVNLNIEYSDIIACISNVLIEHANKNVDLKVKVTLRPTEDTFYTAMPSGVKKLEAIGNKTIQRISNLENKDVPSVCGTMFLNDYTNGDLLAIMDATWLTSMRTGCVAALSALNYAKKDSSVISFIGLGNTAKATLIFISKLLPNIKKVKVYKYKDYAQKFINDFKDYDFDFEIVDEYSELFNNADIVVSSLTFAEKPFVKPEWLTDGILAIPIHMRGWQDCDPLFDKVFTDDLDHTKDWLPKFSGELGEVLSNRIKGRESENEKIICYNYGIAIDDLAIAKLIYDKFMLSSVSKESFVFDDYSSKNII